MLRGIISGAPWPFQTATAAGTTAGAATLLSARVSTVSTDVGATGAKLPLESRGSWYVVHNEGSQSAVIYPSGSDEFIVAGAGAGSETVAIGRSALFVGNGLGQWMVFRSA